MCHKSKGTDQIFFSEYVNAYIESQKKHVIEKFGLKTLGLILEDEKLKDNTDKKSKKNNKAKEARFKIHEGDVGYSYEKIFGIYLAGSEEVNIEEPYIREMYQIINFLRFCVTVLKNCNAKKIILKTKFNYDYEKKFVMEKLNAICDFLKKENIDLIVEENNNMHDRLIYLDNGWEIKIGRGLNIYKKPESWFDIGNFDLESAPCLETTVDIYKTNK